LYLANKRLIASKSVPTAELKAAVGHDEYAERLPVLAFAARREYSLKRLPKYTSKHIRTVVMRLKTFFRKRLKEYRSLRPSITNVEFSHRSSDPLQEAMRQQSSMTTAPSLFETKSP
jgi:hypothetical protein